MESLGLSLSQETRRLGTGQPGDEFLRIAAARQVPLQTGEPNPTCGITGPADQ